MSPLGPRAADLVRKALAGGLAVAVTVLFFRAMLRLADHRGSWADLELWLASALAVLGVAWVRAARRVRRHPDDPPRDEGPGGTDPGHSSGAASASSSEKTEIR